MSTNNKLPTVSVKIFLFTLLLFTISQSVPIYLNEIQLPTGDDDSYSNSEGYELNRLSNEELLALERVLLDEIAAQEGYVEDVVPMVRERRAGGHHNTVPILADDGALELFPVVDEEEENEQPIFVVRAPELRREEEQFLLVPEEGDVPFLQGQSDPDGSPRPVLLTAEELDELELRQRISELGDQLKERALRGMI